MSTTTNTDLHDLRLRIARARGYRVERDPPVSGDARTGDFEWYGYARDGKRHRLVVWHDSDTTAWASLLCYLPKWSTNAGDALALCLDIARERNYRINITPDGDDEGREWFSACFMDNVVRRYLEYADTATEALARLALSALEAPASDGGEGA